MRKFCSIVGSSIFALRGLRSNDEGVVDEAAGNTREAIGRGRRKVGEVIEDIGEAIKK